MQGDPQERHCLITPALEVDAATAWSTRITIANKSRAKGVPPLVYWGQVRCSRQHIRDGAGHGARAVAHQMKTFLEYHPTICSTTASVPSLYLDRDRAL